MYAVIGGAGEIGYQVASMLQREGHDLAIIENDPERLESLGALDALLVRGNAASPKILKKAGIENADIYFALTGSDEANIVSAAIAKSKGCKTLAKIDSVDYMLEPVSTALSKFGVDLAVCPDLVASRKLARMMTMSYLVDMETFAGGRVVVIELPIKDTTAFADVKVGDVKLPPGSKIAAVVRGKDVMIARPHTRLRGDDRLIISCTDPRVIGVVGELFGDKNVATSVAKVMIFGATRVGVDLAKKMERRCNVVLLDDNNDRCKKATEELENTLVLNGDATDERVLEEEGIKEVDAFVAATEHEDTNMLTCLLAKQYGASRTIALISKGAHKSIFERIGIDVAISPRLSTVGILLQAVYAESTIAMSIMHAGELKIAEIRVSADARIANRTIRRARFPDDSVILGILRGDEIIAPESDTIILPGDRVVVAALSGAAAKLRAIFERRRKL